MMYDTLYLEIFVWIILIIVNLTEQCSQIEIDRKGSTDKYRNCLNRKNTENPLDLFPREYKLHEGLTEEAQNDQQTDLNQRTYSQSHTRKSCKRPSRYIKTKRKLKGSKNHRKRLKKKKRYRKKKKKKQ